MIISTSVRHIQRAEEFWIVGHVNGADVECAGGAE
jgi:hypothetical protein